MALTHTSTNLTAAGVAVAALDHACERLGAFPRTVSVNIASYSTPPVVITLQLSDEDAGRLVDVLGLDAPRVVEDRKDHVVHVRVGDLDGVGVRLFGRLAEGVTA